MVLTCAEMKALEARAFADGVSAEALMEEAGTRIAAAVHQFLPRPGRCVVHFGKGHNGGDALVAARHLAARGWVLELRPAFPPEAWAELTRRKHQQLGAVSPKSSGPDTAILDGLLGIGAGGPLREPIRGATRTINRSRAETDARVFAIDLPSGLDGDTGAADADAVQADYTLTIGCAKPGLLADAAASFVGRLAILPLDELTARLPNSSAAAQLATPGTLKNLLPRRPFDTHKGDCGRVGIIAGSAGLTGAAVMCAEAAVHAGAGLVTLYVTSDIHAVVSAKISPEVMVKPVRTYKGVLTAKHDVLVVGPGLGRGRDAEVLEVLARAPQPMVIDADALNALSSRLDLIATAGGPRLLTPHPGEMQRLVPASEARARRQVVEEFTQCYNVTLLLKGARTVIGQRGRPLSYNTTGSPGMATGGMGDVLSGVCGALAGQKLDLYDAARLGAWLCGRAAELALATGESEESLSATHVIAQLGGAFRELRAGGY
ncbi:MAG: ADP-dependent NAD(P)H-hydrate dehydratase / NAD(P)H-hydrate epimerase [Chthoniobacter sp.]|jgi:NAD(P)H-hydrate epimerase|nr:ADP-dependent NAD(P)H-hydrate dehydratase / NAD(P)H-hydrate epimerase [Chthoniobacter sp.]